MVVGMSDASLPRPAPVTAGDVRETVGIALAALRGALAADWHARAGRTDWDCWQAIEHVSDDLFAYAAQLGPSAPALRDPVPFAVAQRGPGGPEGAIAADPAAGPAGLLQVLEATGALLAAMVAATPERAPAPRPFGVADPACFAAAAGVAETLLHTHDVALGLGISWDPPAGPARRALARLFPAAPAGGDPWAALLWATGRGELPGLPAVTQWHWHTGPADTD
jgi:hypothetical protein